MRYLMVCVLLIGLAGCASRPRAIGERPAEELLQPPLRALLNELAGQGFEGAGGATVFVLSHWALYDRHDTGEVNRRRFEGAPFEHEGARVFVTIGPIHQYWKKPPLPAEDRIIPSPADESGRPAGATIQLAGQDWTIGFAMKDGTADLQERLSAILLDWGRRYSPFALPKWNRWNFRLD